MTQETCYTKEDVILRNGKTMKEVWIIINNVIYDCTSYLDDHPGGPDLITDWAGMDATREFEIAGHSSEALRDLKKLRIGVLDVKSSNSNVTTMVVTSEKSTLHEKKEPKKRKFCLFC